MDAYGNWTPSPPPSPSPFNPPYTPYVCNGTPMAIDYAGPPLLTPPAIQSLVVDVNGRVWIFVQNQWN